LLLRVSRERNVRESAGLLRSTTLENASACDCSESILLRGGNRVFKHDSKPEQMTERSHTLPHDATVQVHRMRALRSDPDAAFQIAQLKVTYPALPADTCSRTEALLDHPQRLVVRPTQTFSRMLQGNLRRSRPPVSQLAIIQRQGPVLALFACSPSLNELFELLAQSTLTFAVWEIYLFSECDLALVQRLVAAPELEKYRYAVEVAMSVRHFIPHSSALKEAHRAVAVSFAS
jgi:hypothetical protein